jgi:hypothetical protein
MTRKVPIVLFPKTNSQRIIPYYGLVHLMLCLTLTGISVSCSLHHQIPGRLPETEPADQIILEMKDKLSH